MMCPITLYFCRIKARIVISKILPFAKLDKNPCRNENNFNKRETKHNKRSYAWNQNHYYQTTLCNNLNDHILLHILIKKYIPTFPYSSFIFYPLFPIITANWWPYILFMIFLPFMQTGLQKLKKNWAWQRDLNPRVVETCGWRNPLAIMLFYSCIRRK